MKRHVDLCAGLGTCTIALREHGYNTVLACDISPHCRDIYRANHGEVPWNNDVFSIKELPQCEILTAGCPCQSFSLAGKKLGFACPINGGIFHRVLQLVREAKTRRGDNSPGIIIFENVLGLKSINNGLCLKEIVDQLIGMDYNVVVQRVDAEHWGSPAARSRLFIVARQAASFAHLPPFPLAPMLRGRIRDHLEPGPHVWCDLDAFIIMARDKWRNMNNGKIFVGYVAGRKIRGNGDPTLPCNHSQSTHVFHQDGLFECVTHHRMPTWVPNEDGGDQGRVRELTVREMSNMFGLPRDFVHHEKITIARAMICNGISLFALRPVVAWALG
jgi:DNA-cytosine methyltransferase